ncbi:MAG: sugar kinase [Proteobacteria bacterium]|nr:sugar kinase [Pseudomonadota bacterium]
MRVACAAGIARISVSRMATLVCFGEVLLRLSAPGFEPLLRSARLEARFGGAEINVGIALAYLGHRVRAVTALPDNPIGAACLGELRRHGVDTSGVHLRPGRQGLYYYTAPAQLRPAQVVYDRAHSAFALAGADHYDWPALLREAQWLHLSGITPALGEAPLAALQSAVAAARAQSVRISFDCNIRRSLWQGREQQAPTLLRPLAERAQLLIGNADDIEALFGGARLSGSIAEQQQQAAQSAFAACPDLQHVAATHRLTHSADHHTLTGLLCDRRATHVSRAFELDPVIERIGGGDAFAAGVLHGLCGNADAQASIDFATAASALKHTLPGDFSTLGAADVEHLLQGGRLDVRR